MKSINALYFILCLAPALVGCSTVGQQSIASSTDRAVEAKPPIVSSLFPSDQAVLGEDAVNRILSSKLELPRRAKVALLKFQDAESWGSRYYGPGYWRDEEYLKVQQGQVDTLSRTLTASDQIGEVLPLPSLMTPRQPSIPLLREAAVRLQADLLFIFRVSSDTYSRYRLFEKDKVKSYSTCEVVVLDVRTGLVPFTRVLSRERMERKQSTDLDLAETMRRSEQASAMDALQSAAQGFVSFIQTIPK